MPNDNELIIRINGSAKQFSDELKKVRKLTDDLEKGLSRTARISAIAFTALAAAVGAAAVRFSKFESTFTNVVTLLDKGSFSTKTLEEGIAGLKEGVVSLGAETGESFETLNKGLFDLISAGVKAEDAIDTLNAATRLAIAGATDTSTAVKALTSALTAFGDEAGTAQEIAEKFFTAQKFGVTTVGELAQEFNKVAGLGKNLGLSFDEVLAAATSLTANGAKPTAEAFVEMRGAMAAVLTVQARLNKQSPAVQKALSLQNIKQNGLVKALQDTKTALGGNLIELRKLFPDVRAFSAVLSLTGEQAELFSTILREMGNDQQRAATFAEALRVKQETLERSMARLKVSVDAVAVTFGEAFAPTLIEVSEALSQAAQRFNEMDDETKEGLVSLVKFGLALTAVTLGTATFGLGIIKTVRFIKALTVTLKASRIAAAAFTGALTLGLGTVIAFLPEIIDGMKALFDLTGKPQEPKGVEAITDGIKDLKKEQEELENAEAANSARGRGRRVKQILAIEKEIKKLEELKRREEEFAKLTPKQREAVVSGTSVGATETPDDANLDAVLEAAAAKNAALLAEEKKLNAEKDRLREEDLEKQRDAEEMKREAILEDFEARLEQDQELQEFLNERKDELDAEDLAKLQKQLLTKEKIRSKAAAAEVAAELKRREQFIKDELKFGKTVATLNKILASDKVQAAKGLSGELIGLQRSENNILKTIGKAAALTSIAIRTAEGAVAAHTGAIKLLGPIVGPIVGTALAASVIAFGLEQSANVASAARGGVAPGINAGSRDRQLMLTEPGEIMVPKALAPDFIQSVGRPEVGGDDETPVAKVELTLKDGLMEFIEAEQIERGNLQIALGG